MITQTVSELLEDRVTLDLEGIDRLYLNAYLSTYWVDSNYPAIQRPKSVKIPAPYIRLSECFAMPLSDTTTKSTDLLPVGISDFGKLIRGDHTFIDKSLLIRDIIRSGAEVTLITRPRRFGKTLNLSMLRYFFSAAVAGQPTRELFKGLAIDKDPKSMAHQGQYPVIFFTFKGINSR